MRVRTQVRVNLLEHDARGSIEGEVGDAGSEHGEGDAGEAGSEASLSAARVAELMLLALAGSSRIAAAWITNRAGSRPPPVSAASPTDRGP